MFSLDMSSQKLGSKSEGLQTRKIQTRKQILYYGTKQACQKQTIRGETNPSKGKKIKMN